MSSDSSKAPVVVLDNLRSAFNVGAVFRTAECLGAARLHLCGYTAAQGGRAAREVSPKLTLPKVRESNWGCSRCCLKIDQRESSAPWCCIFWTLG